MKYLILLMMIGSVMAEDIKTKDGKEYKDITILGNDPDALRIMYPSGTRRILFENLSKEIQKKYNYDPIKAKEFDKKEQEKNALSDQAYLESINNKAKEQSKTIAQEETKKIDNQDRDKRIAELERQKAFFQQQINTMRAESLKISYNGKIKLIDNELAELRK